MLFSEIRCPIEVEFHMEHVLDMTILAMSHDQIVFNSMLSRIIQKLHL